MSVWKKFQEHYPNADLSKFTQKDWSGDSVLNNVYFKSKDGEEEIQVFGRGKFIYGNFTKEVKKALGLEHHEVKKVLGLEHHEVKKVLGLEHHEVINLSNFPQELILNPKPTLPVPALSHADKPRTFNFSNLEIFVTPADYFKMKFRDVFTDTKLTHHSAKESHKWLNSPDMKYWPQQLNFAVWCATTGCGISSKI